MPTSPFHHRRREPRRRETDSDNYASSGSDGDECVPRYAANQRTVAHGKSKNIRRKRHLSVESKDWERRAEENFESLQRVATARSDHFADSDEHGASPNHRRKTSKKAKKSKSRHREIDSLSADYDESKKIKVEPQCSSDDERVVGRIHDEGHRSGQYRLIPERNIKREASMSPERVIRDFRRSGDRSGNRDLDQRPVHGERNVPRYSGRVNRSDEVNYDRGGRSRDGGSTNRGGSNFGNDGDNLARRYDDRNRGRNSDNSAHRSYVSGNHRGECGEAGGGMEWGKPDNRPSGATGANATVVKEKPSFELSGKLVEDTNKHNGVVVSYNEPKEAKKPVTRWRMYPFKGDESLPVYYVHRQSAYLIGRERRVADIPVDHPSCSKQHAVLQYRLVPVTRPDGVVIRKVKPYVMDLGSANGTFLNNDKIEPKRYYELFEKDMLKFGFSSREYVLLHENSKEDLEEPELLG